MLRTESNYAIHDKEYKLSYQESWEMNGKTKSIHVNIVSQLEINKKIKNVYNEKLNVDFYENFSMSEPVLKSDNSPCPYEINFNNITQCTVSII